MSLAMKLIALFHPGAAMWNPADSAPNLAFSDGNLTVTHLGPDGDQDVRGVTSHASGKWRYEITTASTDPTNGRPGAGVANRSQSLTGLVGVTTNGAAAFANGTILNAAGGGGSASAFLPGTMAIEADLDGMLLYFQKFGGTRTSGFDISGITGPFLPILDIFLTGNVVTANFGGSPWIVTPTSGYDAWG